MSRPICVHCGKAYGRRDVTEQKVQWFEGDDKPAYKGNGIVVKEHFHGTSMSRGELEKETLHRATGRMVTAHTKADLEALVAAAPERRRHTLFRWIWDGESWAGGYEPFCTLRCALAYARRAYERQLATTIHRGRR